MRRIQPSFALIAAATGVFGIATVAQAAPENESGNNNQSQQQQQQKSEQQSADKQSKQAPEGFVLVDEQVITLTANEPQNHFLRAHEYLAANDPKAAAAEVRIAAGYLDMQASRKGNADQQEVRTESNQLRQFANQLSQNAGQQNQQQAEQKELSQQFARADEVLAKHFQQEASNEINRKRPIMAGHDLDAAASALKASCVWSGEKCSKEVAQAIADARRLSDELLSPVPAGNAENKPQNQQETNAEESKEEAQPAAARISGNQNQNGAETNRIPADASKTVDELGKAIDSAFSQNPAQKTGNEAAQPDKGGQSSTPEKK